MPHFSHALSVVQLICPYQEKYIDRETNRALKTDEEEEREMKKKEKEGKRDEKEGKRRKERRGRNPLDNGSWQQSLS